MIEAVEVIPPVAVDTEMDVNIPRVSFSQAGTFSVEYDVYQVPKTDGVLAATLQKLFDIRSLTSGGTASE